MGEMRALGLAILLCAACAKKPAVKAPAPAASEPAAPGGAAEAAPAPAPPPAAQPMERKANGDPCSGGERK
jgi:hypothetical protein